MSVDVYATERHYLDHLLPVALELGARVYTVGPLTLLPGPARRAGALKGTPPAGRDPVLVASYRDELDVRRTTGRPVILLEHGAGQHYGNASPGYSGGSDRGDVVLFLCPNETVAARNREVYPNAAIEVIGCPKLDPWHLGRRLFVNHRDPIVAFAFHWDCHVVPEARSAFPHYAGELEAIARRFPGALGHAHPRILGELAPAFEAAGLEVVPDLGDVLDRADVLAFDNTSAGYEFASTDRPVVALNAPWYRRDVSHGLRFWETVPGPMVDGPAELGDALEVALEDVPAWRAIRREAVDTVYASADGRATDRAARAIDAIMGGERCRD